MSAADAITIAKTRTNAGMCGLDSCAFRGKRDGLSASVEAITEDEFNAANIHDQGSVVRRMLDGA